MTVVACGDSGDEVVLLFAMPPAGAVTAGAPRQQLVAFVRVSLDPTEATTAQLDITQRQLAGAIEYHCWTYCLTKSSWNVFCGVLTHVARLIEQGSFRQLKRRALRKSPPPQSGGSASTTTKRRR